MTVPVSMGKVKKGNRHNYECTYTSSNMSGGKNNNKLFSCLVQKCGQKGLQMRCCQCLEVKYCSRDCQRGDWKAHKVTCRTIEVSASGGQPQPETKR